MKKTPNELSSEELLKQLETSKDGESSPLLYDKMSNFIDKFNITPGKHRVHISILQELYKRYYNTTISNNSFSYQLTKYIKQVHKICYINKNSLTIKSESLRLLEDSQINKIKTPRKKKHFENYINKYKLKAGKLKVHIDCLYYLYDKWCYEIKRNSPYSKDNFQRLVLLYFPTSHTSWTVHAFLDESITEYISKEKINEFGKKKEKTKVRKPRS